MLGDAGFGEEILALGCAELAPLAGSDGQLGDVELPDADAVQTESGMTDCGGHAADLTVFSFA